MSGLSDAMALLSERMERATPELQVSVAKVCGLMAGYDARWSAAEWVLLGEPEEIIRLPIVNPETGRTSRTFTQAGKFDGRASGYGKTVLVEHKSTSDDIADPNAVYWRRLAIDSQVSDYALKSWQSGTKLDGTLYDVIRKPGIRPKALTKAAVTEITREGTYCGFAVPSATLDLVLAGRTGGDENPDLYALRVAREAIDEPDRYFQRRMIPRLDGDVLEYANELWTIADEIRLARVTGRHFRNSGACMDWGRPCEYLGLCSGHDEPTSDRWKRVDDVHEELHGVTDGRDVLTHSRIKCFQSCRRKHQLRYELGLRRAQDDEPESLWLGSLLHEALAAWWSETKGDSKNGDACHGPAVSEIAEPAAADRLPQ